MGRSELSRRWGEAQHLIRENGVTYNVYGDPRGMDRPWQLDPIPHFIVAERSRAPRARADPARPAARSADADLYGPQHCLAEGLLPRELVFANPAFLRPCHNICVPHDRYLHLYAANIGRAADGALPRARRSHAVALGGRLCAGKPHRAVADAARAFRDCRVQRLALFFRTLRDTLRAIAPHNRDNPRIVLLTPGPYNETYFEHAYLARYLGYTLVEGGDLTVRDNRVYLKVLGGLQPVDVIFRRLDDDYCDPLELRPDSFLGVPGLVQAVRAGNVAVANALGTGLLETPGLLAFLPGAVPAAFSAKNCCCRRSPPGGAASRVGLRLRPGATCDELVIKPAHAGIALRAGLRRRTDGDQSATSWSAAFAHVRTTTSARSG